MTRKLTTILAADVAGYSQLIEQDEQGTLDALRRVREIVAQAVETHNGRVFGGAGDSIIADFGSAVEATKAAVVIQKEIGNRRASNLERPDLQFRIGINIGDVVVEGDDLLGDGVNVAARLEALAEPGGICLSHAVFEQVQGKVDFQFEPLGQHKLKNIARRVSVYRVVVDETARPARPSWRLMGPKFSLSVAVMPLITIGSDDATRRLADGLTEDIITDLSRFSNLEILASNTIAAYKDKPDAIGAIARDLDVSYVLQGTIQRAGESMRISAQLLDMESGSHLWTQRWDRPFEDTFAVQSELAEQVAATLGSAESSAAITASEIRKVKSRPPASMEAYDYYLLAEEENGRFTKEAVFSGIKYATRAIELDPRFARAYAVRARMHFNTTHYGVDYDEAMGAMEADALKAVELDPSGPQPRAALAWYYFVSGRNKDAEVQLRSALEVNPANITLIKMGAAVFGSSGLPEEGAKLADKVLKLDPLATSGTLNTIKDAYFFSRRFEDTISVISRVPPDSRSRGSRLFLAFSLALVGRENDAQRARDQVLSAYPNISAELLLNQGWVFEREEDLRLFVEGFSAADIPVCATAADLTKTEDPIRLPECLDG